MSKKKLKAINILPVSLENQKWLYVKDSERFTVSSMVCPSCSKLGSINGMFEYELHLKFECDHCNFLYSFEDNEMALRLNATIYLSEKVINKFNITNTEL